MSLCLAFRSFALALAAGLAACGPGGAPDPGFTATRLADGIFLVSGPDGNVVAARSGSDLVVIDGGSAERAAALRRFILREIGARRVTTLINTNWRPERVGLNALLGAEGTAIVAHINARQWLAYGGPDRAGDEGAFPPAPEEALPDLLIHDEGGTVPFGDGEIQLGHLLQAHTDADLYAYFPDANVLVAGGAIRADGWTMIDWGAGAYLGGLDDAHRTLLAVTDENTVIVPGSGPVMTRADLEAQSAMYAELFSRIAHQVLSAKSPAEAVAARPTGEYHPEWADADEFVDRAYRSFRTHIRRDPRLGAIP